MKIFIYCYGPISLEKDLFCKNFLDQNKNYSLVCSSAIREKIYGSKFSKNQQLELATKQSIIEECIKNLNKKNKNVILNSSLFNESSRISLLKALEKEFNFKIKIAAISFLPKNAEDCFNNLKQYQEYSDLDFKYLSNQFANFKFAEKQEEGDVLINKIENSNGKIYLDTKLWGKNETITCDNFKKLSEYIKFTNSF